MADSPSGALRERHRAASSAVATALEAFPAYRSVSGNDVSPLLAWCSPVWQRAFSVGDRTRTIQVGLPPQFPDAPPVACVLEWEDLVLRNPHVLDKGVLCVIPDSAAIDSGAPADLVAHTFQEAVELLKGQSPNDFREEFGYYWELCATKGAARVVLVEPPNLLGETFPTVSEGKTIYAASCKDKLDRWLRNAYGGAPPEGDWGTGIVIRVTETLIPREYPRSVADLLALAKVNDPSATRALKWQIVGTAHRNLALLLQTSERGAALGATTFDGLGLRRKGDSDLTRGFRPGKVPDGVLVRRSTRRIVSAETQRGTVTRVDAERLHTRGGDGRDLSGKSVLIIGGGSLGGYVAHLLSRSGVGRLTLIDSERLIWANIGRHFLGAAYVGQWKAEALAKELGQQMPHLEIDGVAADWRDYVADYPDLFTSYDIVLSTVASWRCEATLNALARSVQMPHILLGWLEPFGVAGHCLAMGERGGCFQCSANQYGRFGYGVSVFDRPTLSREPGGCTHYQQYGPIAMMQVATLVASAATDILGTNPAGSTLRTWISSAEHFTEAGATLSDTWAPRIEDEGYSRIFHTEWERSKECQVCSRVIT